MLPTICVALASVLLGVGQPEKSDPLRGPLVPERATRTIVRHDARGNFVRIEGRPEDAAVGVLELEPEVRERVVGVRLDRAVAMGMHLVDEIDSLKGITDATKEGDRARATELMQGLWHAIDGEKPVRDPLLRPLAQVLSPEHQAEVARLVEEYWGAWVAWEGRAMMDQTPEGRRRVEERLSFQLFQEEARGAYERTLRPYNERMEAMYRALEPTAEQRAAIRGIYIEFIKATRLRPTADDRRAAVRRIYDALDEERRAKLFDLVVRQIDMGE